MTDDTQTVWRDPLGLLLCLRCGHQKRDEQPAKWRRAGEPVCVCEGIK